MQPTFDMLYLTCSCHHRNDHLSASWQDYLDTSYCMTAETISNFWGVSLGPHPGILEILKSPPYNPLYHQACVYKHDKEVLSSG